MTDQELLEQYHRAETRETGFRMIVRQFQKPIYYYIRRMVLDHDDADDITQTTFIKAWKGLDGFRGESKLSTWLHTIAYHEAISFLDKKKRVAKVALDQVGAKLGHALQQDELYQGDEIRQRLQVAVASLPAKQKAVFIMKYYEEKKYEEIAEITGTSVGALKASYHHAVQKIEEHITGNANTTP
jgi:RNA polymerase sigma-70 factor (ECF subfamily)